MRAVFAERKVNLFDLICSSVLESALWPEASSLILCLLKFKMNKRVVFAERKVNLFDLICYRCSG